MLNVKGKIFKKINISLIVHFCLDKYNFNLNTLQTGSCTHTHTHTYIYIYIQMNRSMKRFVFLRIIHLFCSYICVCFQLVAFIREHMWHKAMCMGYLMKPKLKRCLLVECFSYLHGFSPLSFFLRVCLFFFLSPIGHWYLMCYKVFVLLLWVDVCVLKRFWILQTVTFSSLRVLGVWLFLFVWV